MNRPALAFSLATVLSSSNLLAAAQAPNEIAPEIRAAGSERLAFALQARGVQIYACRQSRIDAYAYEWVFVAPDATLSEGETVVGHHDAGPVWRSTTDGSSVKGSVRAKQDGGPGNIPWLLLSAESSGGEGRFGRITSVQRVATHGGAEPKEPCDSARAGLEARVPYTAEYRFFRRG